MNSIDEVGLIISTLGTCTLCTNPSSDIYTAKFTHPTDPTPLHLSYKVCTPCMKEISDLFSLWVPIFCIHCLQGSWLLRNPDVPDQSHAGFTDGCWECTGIIKKGWWL